MEQLIDNDLTSMRNAAHLLGLTPRQVGYRVSSRKLPSVLVGTVRLVRLGDVKNCRMTPGITGRPRGRKLA